MSGNTNVTLEITTEADLPEFARRLQEAFLIAVEESFGPWDGGPIPSDRDIWQSFNVPNAIVYHVLQNEQRVGGVVLKIDEETQHNSLDLFFISPEYHSHGLGLAAWKATEAKYPNTRVWETVTPYFEKRNIHFYVNKCGFHIVEFFNQYHTDPHMHHPECQDGKPMPGTDDYFRFEKIMQ